MTPLVRRVAPLAVLAVIMLTLTSSQRIPPAQADLWFHLRLGEEFLHGWGLGSPGSLGRYDTAAWIPTQWLGQVALAWLSVHVGLDWVVVAVGTVVLLVVALLYTSARGQAAPLPSVVAVTLGTLAAAPGLSARPQLLSYLFVVLTTSAWLATWRDGRPRWWLVAIAWVWPMCHGMWPVGLTISIACLVGLALEGRVTGQQYARLAVLPVASLLVTAATPVGLGAFQTLYVAGSRSAYFSEWGPPDFTDFHGIVVCLMLAVIVLAGLRSSAVPWTHALLTLLAMGWAAYSYRTTMVAALILTPLVASALARLVPDNPPLGRRERLAVGTLTLLACSALVPIVTTRPAGSVVPTWVDLRLDAMAPGTRVLNDWDAGSYLLYRHPDLDLVMHGYGDVFTDAEIRRNYDLTQLAPGWDETVSDLDVDAALLDPESRLGYALTHVLEWSVLEGDDDFVLLAPPSR